MKTSLCWLQLFLATYLLLGRAKSDPHPLQDYCIAMATNSDGPEFNGAPCINPKHAHPQDFVTSVLGKPAKTKNQFGFNVTLTNTDNLPGLNTMGLTMARIDIGPNGLVPPHSHPRASELTICLKGSILVGFVDTANKQFTQTLRPGEAFVFPKGLTHFLLNVDTKSSALAVSGLNSQSPGAQIGSTATFASKPPIIDEVLKKAFQISGQDVTRIRNNLGG
ncbi:hypothetical protein ACFE04_024480 [Oxalis oulophora]